MTPSPKQRELVQRFGIVGGDVALDGQGAHAARAAKRPLRLPGNAGERKAVVAQQVFRLFRLAVPFEVGGRGGDHALQIADPARNEIDVAKRTDANRDIDPGLDQVDVILGDDEVKRDLREPGREFGQRRHQSVGGEGCAHTDAQTTARLVGEAHDVGFRIGDLADDALHAFEVDFALRGQRQTARRALEQAHAEFSLQSRHEFRHRRRRDAQIARGRGESVAFDGADEGQHRQARLHRQLHDGRN